MIDETEQEFEDKINKNVVFTMPCLYCNAPVEVEKEGYEAQGIFNVFCLNRDCEDRYALSI